MGFHNTINFITEHPLNKRQKIKSLLRFMKWQIKCRLSPGFHVCNFGEKSKILVKQGLTGATGNIYCGLHEFEDMSFLLHFLTENDKFIDIGANVGSYTLLSASECDCKTVSIEPVPETFDILSKNILLNDLDQKVDTYNIGLGSENKILKFTKSLDTVNHVTTDDDTESVEVEVKRFDDIFDLNKPTLIKMDVEGYETEVLKGMANALINKNFKALIIELNGSGSRYGYDENRIHKNLLSFGFLAYNYDPFQRKLFKRETPGDLNTIYIKDYDFVLSRLQHSRKYFIHDCEF